MDAAVGFEPRLRGMSPVCFRCTTTAIYSEHIIFYTNISSIVSISKFAVRALNFSTYIISKFHRKVKIKSVKFSKKGKVLSVQDAKRLSALLLVEDVGLEPRLRIPNAVCYHYTTSSMLVVDRGLEPAIICVRGRPPNQFRGIDHNQGTYIAMSESNRQFFRSREMS